MTIGQLQALPYSQPRSLCRAPYLLKNAVTRKQVAVKATLVKVCGVTCVEDAKVAVDLGADIVGMIMWPKAKRSVSVGIAKQICDTVHQGGAKCVGVFVDEDAQTILERGQLAGIDFAQLHGDGARSANVKLFEGKIRVIYVLNANDDGIIQTKFPDNQDIVEYFLVDGMKGGSGKTYDWSGLQTNLFCNKNWLMAGGLKPENVGLAVQQLAPTGVDVSSGVCTEDGLRKDPEKIKAFIESVKKVSSEPETSV